MAPSSSFFLLHQIFHHPTLLRQLAVGCPFLALFLLYSSFFPPLGPPNCQLTRVTREITSGLMCRSLWCTGPAPTAHALIHMNSCKYTQTQHGAKPTNVLSALLLTNHKATRAENENYDPRPTALMPPLTASIYRPSHCQTKNQSSQSTIYIIINHRKQWTAKTKYQQESVKHNNTFCILIKYTNWLWKEKKKHTILNQYSYHILQ